jgi:hypothetical protein
MKKLFLISFVLISFSTFAQDHFAGIATSSRVGILTADNNPAELANLPSKHESNISGISVNVTNNKISYKDITSGNNLKNLLFQGIDPVNFKVDAVTLGPGYAIKLGKVAFGFSSKLNAKLDVIDVDPKIGEALANGGVNSLLGLTTINNNTNQRISATTWSEIGVTGAFNILKIGKHKLNVGATVKLLFPGSFANMGAQNYIGQINTTNSSDPTITNTIANLNFAYSGGFASSLVNVQDYTKNLFGKLNGLGGDIGVNYQLIDGDGAKNKYKVNIGLAVKNFGGMTYSDNNNYSTDYNLNIPSGQYLHLNDFNGVNSIQQVENILISKGFLNKTAANTEFKVSLPTTFTAYIDMKLISKFFVSGYFQSGLIKNNDNYQITSNKVVTITPRFSTSFFELFSPWTKTEFAGTIGGAGIRLGGFYLGSNSAITSILNNGKQIDFYTGFRFSI